MHDEIDLPFGDVRVRLGGGLAGHNGLKSLRRDLGAPDFHRVRVGVGRPDSTDPDIVAAYVLGKWRQPAAEVAALVDARGDEVERLVPASGARSHACRALSRDRRRERMPLATGTPPPTSGCRRRWRRWAATCSTGSSCAATSGCSTPAAAPGG